MLLEAHQEAAIVRDKLHFLALHLASLAQAEVEVVSTLLQAYPEGPDGVCAEDKNSFLPLHFAGLGYVDKEMMEVVAVSVSSKFWEELCIIFTVSTKLHAAQLRAAAERSSTAFF